MNPRYCATPIEPRGVLAVPEGDGVCVWSSTQAPYRVRAALCGAARAPARGLPGALPRHRRRLRPEGARVPGGDRRRLAGASTWTGPSSGSRIAARTCSPPATRATRRCAFARRRAPTDALLGIEADVVCDAGAYGVYPQGHLLEAAGTPGMIPGPYRVESYRARGPLGDDEQVPRGRVPRRRAPGLGVRARAPDGRPRRRARHRPRRDQASQLRPAGRVSLHARSRITATTAGEYAAALDAALEAIGYDGFEHEQEQARSEGRLLGLGLSSYVEFTGINSKVFARRGILGIPGYDGACVKLGDDGGATLWTTLPSMGQGLSTTFAQLVAEALGLRVEDVTVARPDTSVGGLEGTGTFASRSAIAGGGAIQAACAVVRDRLLDDAAVRLEVAAADLEVVDGAVRVVGAPERAVGVAELAAAAEEGRYEASERFDPPEICYPYATHACVVEVDAETGRVHVLRYAIVEDCGTVINPMIVEGQTHGATAQGIGGTLYEAIAYDEDGQPRQRLAHGLPGADRGGDARARGATPRDALARLAARRQGRGGGRHARASRSDRERCLERARRRAQRAAADAGESADRGDARRAGLA